MYSQTLCLAHTNRFLSDASRAVKWKTKWKNKRIYIFYVHGV